MVLNLCTLSYDALYLVYISAKFHENILNGIKVIKRTQFLLEKFQTGIILQKSRWIYGSFSLHIV